MCKMPFLPTAAQPWRRPRVLSNQSWQKMTVFEYLFDYFTTIWSIFAQFVKRQFYLRDGLPKKIAVLLDFVQMRGGACPNFLSTFHKLYILGQFWDGEGGGDPCPNFLAHWRSKKMVKLSKLGGRGGGRGNLDKIQKNSYFFSGNRP